MTQSPSNTWDRVLEKIQPKVSKHSFSTWFKPTKYLSEDAAEIRIRVPNPWFAEWLLSHYSNQLDQALRDVGRPGLRVDFLPLQDFSSSKPAPAPSPDRPRRRPAASSNRAPAYQNQNGGNSPARPPAAAAPDLPERSAASANPALNPSRARTEKRTGSAFERTGAPSPAAGLDIPLAPTGTLNPKYTFDTFVVSNCNEFAHAASLRVAERPSRSYNPLYIYGGVGLGKTHLMQAVGNLICSGGRMRMQYTSSEAFMNELINAIRFENTHEFKDRYRNIDVLLIDDIQFLAGKERTQEEFFHTFNALYDAQKQIVITSDVPPRDIPTLEERLRSRFEWGLIADIQPPDLETKIAILRKKAESDGFRVPDDVTVFIASHCGANIRELEGALTKVIAYASLSGRDVSVDIAREQLRDLLPSEAPATTVENIQKVVANYYGLNVKDLKAKNNSPQVALPRQVAMYLCKELTPCSLPEIGRRFGGKHHSTVHHAVSKVRQRRADQMDFNNLVETLLKSMSKLA